MNFKTLFFFQLIAIAVVAYHLLELGLCLVAKDDDVENHERFKNFQKLEDIFGSTQKVMVDIVIIAYYLSYVIIGMFMFLFGIFLTCGAHKVSIGNIW